MAAAAGQPGSRPDATGRRLEYLPAAVLGNGDLLVTLSARGEVERLIWPHVDGANTVAEFRIAVRSGDEDLWLDDGPFRWSQEWLEEGTSVLHTTVESPDGEVEVVDAVDPREPVFVRRVTAPAGRLVVWCAPRLGGADDRTGAYVDPDSAAVVVYRRDVALAITTDRPAAAAAVVSAGGHADAVAHVGPVSGRLEADHDGVAHVVVAFGASPFDALARARAHAAAPGAVVEARREADALVLEDVPVPSSLDPALARLALRSVLVLDQLTDRSTGGIVAAPEMDERFAESGGYGFVWPRDLSYVILGLLAARRGEQAAAALRWLVRVQAPEGLWLHRHWTTGELAPSWGLHQLDETGAVLFAGEAAWEQFRDDQLDAEVWPATLRGADFLLRFLDPENGLPKASVDAWEQQDGQHAYTAASVVGGLKAAGRAAARHGDDERARAYRAAAARVAAAIDDALWDTGCGRHLRAVSVSRPGGTAAPGSAFERPIPYPNRRVAAVVPRDDTLDCSLLGLVWPFGALDPTSERVLATVEAVAAGLSTAAGGLHRQAGDRYAGGHEWLLATLWLGLARRALGDEEALQRAVAHVVSRGTALDLLPEQVDGEGRPAWVLPLGWSHAMLLLATQPELRLVEALRAEGNAGDGRGG
jgi:glucoamylase